MQILACFNQFLVKYYQFLGKNHISGLYYEFVCFSVISGIFWLKLRELSRNLSQAEKGLLMLLDSDLPALEMDFLELQESNWRALNDVGKQTSRAFQQYIIVHTLREDRRRKLAFNTSIMLLSGVQRQKQVTSWSSTPKTRYNLAFNSRNSPST